MRKTDRPTLKDIAERSGFSLRTVKKVMSGDSTVKDKTREAVLNAAEELHYVRNRMASTLARHQEVKLAVVYCKTSDAYFPEVEQGFRQSEREFLDYGLVLEYHVHSDLNISVQEKILHELCGREDIRGIILQPLGATRMVRAINEATDYGKPVVTFGSDAPGSRRLCYVGPDAYKAGRIGCQILANYIGKKGRVFLVKRNEDHMQTRDRSRGFLDRMREYYPQMQAIEVLIPNADDPSGSLKATYYRQVRNMIETEDIQAIFCTSANTYLIGQILKQCGRKDIVLVGFDLQRDGISLMHEGYIRVIIEQKPEVFSYEAVKILLQYIIDKERPEKLNYTPLYVLTSECLDTAGAKEKTSENKS